MRHDPRCPECGAFLEAESDEEGFPLYGDCPNECPTHRTHERVWRSVRDERTGRLHLIWECERCLLEEGELGDGEEDPSGEGEPPAGSEA